MTGCRTLDEASNVALELPRRCCLRGVARDLGDQVESMGRRAKKSRSREGIVRPYRKPTQVGSEESRKVNGSSLVKELGKLVP